MKTLSAHLTTMLASRLHTRARCMWMALRDGTIIGITDHDRDITIDQTDNSGSPVTYQANLGIMTSDITLQVGLDADNLEVSGPLSDTITRAGVLGRRFSRASVRVFEVDWSQDNPDILPLMAGHVADSRIEGGSFIFEVRSDFDRYNQTIGRLLSPYCSADFGDTQCGVTPPSASATITSVTSDFQFILNLPGDYADDHFNYGTVEFLTGALAGTEPIEVSDYNGALSAVVLLAPLAEAPEVGDTLTIKRGCSKLKKSDNADLPTCASYANVNRFRGFDQVPGSSTYLKIATPGSQGA